MVYSPTSDLSVLTVNVAREKIYNAPAFEYTRMDEYARPDYMNNIYSYYGVSPGPRTAVAAGTDVTGTAGAIASPGEVASPAAAPAGTGSPSKKPSARTYASSAASSYRAQARILHQKQYEARGQLVHRHRLIAPKQTSSTTTEESPSENTTSPNENRKSRRKAIEDTSTRRPSATTQSAEGQDQTYRSQSIGVGLA